jgi:Chlorophyll A-B binding protein
MGREVLGVTGFLSASSTCLLRTHYLTTSLPSSSKVGTIPSKAIPYERAPALLDGSLVGDAGFDPCFLSTKAAGFVPYFNGIIGGNGPTDGLTWYREAELMHGRICMAAVVGFIAPGFGTISGDEWTGVDAYSYPNPLEAFTGVPAFALLQILAFMAFMEFRRIKIIQEEGPKYMAGDSQRWGQGKDRWNPFKFDYTPAEYAEKQLQELKHGRLAMIGFLGVVFQADASGVSVVQQWSTAFQAPDYFAKAGYFFPEGI